MCPNIIYCHSSLLKKGPLSGQGRRLQQSLWKLANFSLSFQQGPLFIWWIKRSILGRTFLRPNQWHWASFSNIFWSFFWNISYGLQKKQRKKKTSDKFMNVWKCVPTQQKCSELCSTGRVFLNWKRVLVLLNLHTYTPRQLLIRARNRSDVCCRNLPSPHESNS